MGLSGALKKNKSMRNQVLNENSLMKIAQDSPYLTKYK